jgi:hypothetical protein
VLAETEAHAEALEAELTEMQMEGDLRREQEKLLKVSHHGGTRELKVSHQGGSRELKVSHQGGRRQRKVRRGGRRELTEIQMKRDLMRE